MGKTRRESNDPSGEGGGGQARSKMTNHYAVMGIQDFARGAESKRAYHRLALQWHPDRQVHASEQHRKEAEAVFKRINEAYAVLSDSARRKEFDLCLRKELLGVSGKSSKTTRGGTTRAEAKNGHHPDKANGNSSGVATATRLLSCPECGFGAEVRAGKKGGPSLQCPQCTAFFHEVYCAGCKDWGATSGRRGESTMRCGCGNVFCQSRCPSCWRWNTFNGETQGSRTRSCGFCGCKFHEAFCPGCSGWGVWKGKKGCRSLSCDCGGMFYEICCQSCGMWGSVKGRHGATNNTLCCGMCGSESHEAFCPSCRQWGSFPGGVGESTLACKSRRCYRRVPDSGKTAAETTTKFFQVYCETCACWRSVLGMKNGVGTARVKCEGCKSTLLGAVCPACGNWDQILRNQKQQQDQQQVRKQLPRSPQTRKQQNVELDQIAHPGEAREVEGEGEGEDLLPSYWMTAPPQCTSCGHQPPLPSVDEDYNRAEDYAKIVTRAACLGDSSNVTEELSLKESSDTPTASADAAGPAPPPPVAADGVGAVGPISTTSLARTTPIPRAPRTNETGPWQVPSPVIEADVEDTKIPSSILRKESGDPSPRCSKQLSAPQDKGTSPPLLSSITKAPRWGEGNEGNEGEEMKEEEEKHRRCTAPEEATARAPVHGSTSPTFQTNSHDHALLSSMDIHGKGVVLAVDDVLKDRVTPVTPTRNNQTKKSAQQPTIFLRKNNGSATGENDSSPTRDRGGSSGEDMKLATDVEQDGGNDHVPGPTQPFPIADVTPAAVAANENDNAGADTGSKNDVAVLAPPTSGFSRETSGAACAAQPPPPRPTSSRRAGRRPPVRCRLAPTSSPVQTTSESVARTTKAEKLDEAEELRMPTVGTGKIGEEGSGAEVEEAAPVHVVTTPPADDDKDDSIILQDFAVATTVDACGDVVSTSTRTNHDDRPRRTEANRKGRSPRAGRTKGRKRQTDQLSLEPSSSSAPPSPLPSTSNDTGTTTKTGHPPVELNSSGGLPSAEVKMSTASIAQQQVSQSNAAAGSIHAADDERNNNENNHRPRTRSFSAATTAAINGDDSAAGGSPRFIFAAVPREDSPSRRRGIRMSGRKGTEEEEPEGGGKGSRGTQ